MFSKQSLLFWFALALHASEHHQQASAFQPSRSSRPLMVETATSLYLAKATKNKKKKKKGGAASSGLKGFGSGSSKDVDMDLDRSKEARTFYDFMESGGAGDNLKRCGLGFFPLGQDMKLRGVVALKPMKKGDVIIRIPYEQAVNLGQEGADPTGPAVKFLKDYCQTFNDKNSPRNAYYNMLPPFRGDDCMGSTDFFSDDALTALQAPLVSEETLKRRERTRSRFQTDIENESYSPNWGDEPPVTEEQNESFPKWIDGTPVTEEHLQWAVWLITSRVLTVQGDQKEGNSYRLLIPFLDMCNHDRKSPHVLTGRAVPGGELKVVAGASVKEGEQINICYGGGELGNDRFIQDYGFLDVGDNTAFKMVAQQLLGKRRIVEGIGAGRFMSETDREKTLELLRSTTMDQDRAVLESESDPSMKAAYSYRLGVKEALDKFIVML